MSSHAEQERYLQRAIDRVAQADPLLKLVQEVRLGRMKPNDAGLRAVTDSWLRTYRQVLDGATMLDEGLLMRLDPRPRLAVLIDVGMFTAEQPSVIETITAFEQMVAAARQRGRT